MKKMLVLFLSFTMLFASSLSVLANENVINNDEDMKEMKLEEVLIGYFSNFLEVQKKLEKIDNKFVDESSKLKEYIELHSELSIDLYKKTAGQIDWYDVEIKVNSINKVDELIKVDVDNIVKLKYRNTDFDSDYIENHIIYIRNFDGNMKIVKDIFDPAFEASEIEKKVEQEFSYLKNMGEDKYTEGKIEDLNNKIENLDKYIEENRTKNEKNMITPSSVSYNGSTAADWAYRNVYASEDYPGTDCTNFVSKAINYGGIPTDSVWKKGSNAWIRVVELRNWLLNKGYGTQYSNYRYALIGDIVQYYLTSYGNWRHSVIVTARDSWSDYPYVSAHSSPKRNVIASYYYPNGSFSNFRVIDVHGK